MSFFKDKNFYFLFTRVYLWFCDLQLLFSVLFSSKIKHISRFVYSLLPTGPMELISLANVPFYLAVGELKQRLSYLCLQVFVVSASEPRLPLLIEDASRPVGDEVKYHLRSRNGKKSLIRK